MWRRVSLWLASLFVLGVFAAPPALAQGRASTAGGEDASTRSPAFPYTVAFIAFLLVMVIVCSPSRKG
jgi:hypothetical protein